MEKKKVLIHLLPPTQICKNSTNIIKGTEFQSIIKMVDYCQWLFDLLMSDFF